jgi:hypothetical protein
MSKEYNVTSDSFGFATKSFYGDVNKSTHMPSLIISFFLAHWEDILIAFGIAALFFILDVYVVHKGRTEIEGFDATDRLFSYFLLSGVFVFTLIWLDDTTTTKGQILAGFGFIYFIAFIIFVAHRHSLKEQRMKIDLKNRKEKEKQ